jgi:hypothetical protein
MNSPTDRWRRNPVFQYFAGLEPIDRVTALVLLALVAAIAVTFGVSMWSWTPALSSGPFIPTPFDMRFAAVQAGTW